jgi:glycosyltransferase involved in cell wall biosynthesis
MLGIMGGFRQLGWEVESYIAGDRVPRTWSSSVAEAALRRSLPARLAADVLRLFMGPILARAARAQLRDRVDWVYERAAVFQRLGSTFQSQDCPWILEVNAPLSWESRAERRSIALSGLARSMETGSYRRSDVVVTISHALKEIVVRQAGLSPEKVLVIPNGVDSGYFDPQRHAPVRLFEGPTIVFAGWLVPWQGIGLLIDAVTQASAHGIQWNLVVLGDGPCRVLWEEHAAAAGLQSRVRFLGHLPRNQVPAYLAGGDLGFVGPLPMKLGLLYHSPLKLYEYMAMGKPVLAASYPEARETITPGETGFLFEPGDLPSLVQALAEARAAEKSLVELGWAGRKEVLARHTWQHRVGAIVAGVDRVLHHSGVSSVASRLRTPGDLHGN